MDDRLLCRCFRVTEADVKSAVAGGAKTVEEVERQTRLGLSCHACRKTARAFILKSLEMQNGNRETR